ncbi:CCL4 protein, partial [Rhinopomastus cyanomelas]|nr:CCL4 protein [Rhinopomastus cyanomelas]
DMKISVAALAILIAAFCYQTSTSPIASDPPTSCCFSFTLRKLPRQLITEYYETNSQCPKPGIVFVTKKGREVCAKPEQDWVQDYLRELDLN